MRFYLAILTTLLLAGGSLWGTLPATAQSKGEIVIGMQCDRTGATQIVGTVLCPGFHDYVALVNSKGGVEGYTIKALEMALKHRCPEAGLIHHSDQGCTYASEDYQTILTARGITCSMSRRGDCYDCEDDSGAVRPGLTPVTNDSVSWR